MIRLVAFDRGGTLLNAQSDYDCQRFASRLSAKLKNRIHEAG